MNYKNVNSKSKYKRHNIPAGKRLLDILISLSAIIVLFPFFLIIAILIKIDSKGPIFYISKRAGYGYTIFNFYKFRSMKIDAEDKLEKLNKLNQYHSDNQLSGNNNVNDRCEICVNKDHPCTNNVIFHNGKIICENIYLTLNKSKKKPDFIKIKNDPRITPLGRFLRKTSIDELPQLFNVLKGDMSLVGNRPLPLYEAQKLTSDKWIKRFMAPAGITGLWQVSKRGKKKMSEVERKELDIEYAEKYSFWYDAKLIVKTFPALLQSENV